VCILEEKQAYAKQTSEELRELKPGKKLWWSKARQAMGLKPKVSSIPALKDASGKWIMDATEKANLIGNTFGNKYALIDGDDNKYSKLTGDGRSQADLVLPSDDVASNTLANLKADSATGPDAIPTRILRECARSLARPFWILARLILRSGTWPTIWMTHWVVPLYKKNAVFLAGHLQRSPFNAPDFESYGTILLFDVAGFCCCPYLLRAKPIRVPEG
jgi:hypothetical protein